MLALVLDERLRLRDDFPEPDRRAGDARIAMIRAGVCDTDLQLVRGYMGYRGVLGHEFVGRVLEADNPEWVGRRVVADINAGCGRCRDCLERDGHHCAERTVLGIAGRDGAFAQQLVMPERCLVSIPEVVSDDCAVFAEPLAAALHVIDDLEGVEAGPIAVLGDGKLGLLIALALIGANREVVLVGHHRDKLALAADAGASTLLENEVTPALSNVPAAVEATGTPTGLQLALSLLRPRGRVILKTTVAGNASIDWSPVVINELSVIGSRCGSMRRAIELLEKRAVDPTPLIASRYPLARADEALKQAAERGTLKVIIEGSA